MTSTLSGLRTRGWISARVEHAGGGHEILLMALPGAAFIALLLVAEGMEPNALTYNGLNLLLSSAVPLVFAAISQMFIIVLGDIDLGTGYLVGLANVVGARYLLHDPIIAITIFLGIIGAYMAQAALIHLRGIPSIIVTLGSSFIWLGLSLIVLPIPGGSAPDWLTGLFAISTPLLPPPVWMAAIVAAAIYFLTQRTRLGTIIRGTGSNALAVARSGWSVLRVKLICYGMAGLFGILGGLAVTGVSGSGDANASANYTLLAIAAVILGGGSFFGGRSVAVGTVLGALALGLIGPVLTLGNIASSYQTAAQGLILILVLAGRVLMRRSD